MTNPTKAVGGPLTGGQAAVAVAVEAGIEACFANAGTTEIHLVEALDRYPSVRPVLGLFEGVCSGAADGYARIAGKPALTLVHLGPGYANSAANQHNARRAWSPIVNLIGDQASWHLEHDAALTSDIDAIAGWAGWVGRSTSSDDVAAIVGEAIVAAGNRLRVRSPRLNSGVRHRSMLRQSTRLRRHFVNLAPRSSPPVDT